MTPTDVFAWSLPALMWLVLVVFNAAVFLLINGVMGGKSIKQALREKSSRSTQPLDNSTDPNANTSYSRVAGMVGAIVLACFFWGMANVIFVQAFESPENIDKILSGVAPFFLSGSALFAPYAFNQLSQALKP